MRGQKYPFGTEPGRRYAAGRVQPRAGADIGRRVASNLPSSPVVAQPVPQQAAAPKHLDFVPKRKEREVSTIKPALPRQKRSHVLKRHMVERAVLHRKEVRTTRKRHFFGFVGVFMVLGALLIILWSFWDFTAPIKSISFPFLRDVRHATPAVSSSRSTSTLDESKPTPEDVMSWQAAADSPRVLRISKLDLEARVKRVGISLTGEPISPSNIFDVGWYDSSGKPNQQGAILINGHIQGRTKDGVFHNLQTLLPNDEIQVELGDRTVVKYNVVKVQTFTGDQVDMDVALDTITAGKNGLNLVTSSANYDGAANQSGQRVIVFAVQQ